MEKLVSDGYSAFLQDQEHVDWCLQRFWEIEKLEAHAAWVMQKPDKLYPKKRFNLW